MVIEVNPESVKSFLTCLFNKVKECWNRLIEWISSNREMLKAIMDDYKPIYDSPIHPAVKSIVLRGLIVKHQVIDRKPRFIRARTSC